VCNRQRIEAQSLEENLNEKRLASIGGGGLPLLRSRNAREPHCSFFFLLLNKLLSQLHPASARVNRSLPLPFLEAQAHDELFVEWI
jgi:hypothetical protein